MAVAKPVDASCRLATSCLVAILLSAGPGTRAGTNNSASFPSEAWNAWEKYKNTYTALQGKTRGKTTVFSSTSNQLVETVVETDFKQNQNSCSYLTSTTRQTKDPKRGLPKTTVYVVNPKYSFELIKSESGNGWVIPQLRLKDKVLLTAAKTPVLTYVFKAVSPHYLVLGKPIWECAKDPRFKLIGKESMKEGSAELVRYDFELETTLGKTLTQCRGVMILNPSLLWSVVHLRTLLSSEGKPGVKVQGDFKTRAGIGNLPLLEKEFFRSAEKEQDGSYRQGQYTWDVTEDCSVPEQQFTLAAFGLPEPEGIYSSGGIPYYLRFIAAGLVAALLGLLLHRYKRRLQRKAGA